MGVDLKDVVPRTEIDFAALHGKVLAVDALNALYQFLAIIRQRDGEVLKDSQGRTTSHLSGLFYRSINLLEMGIRPVYVFDGTPPREKIDTLRERKEHKDEAKKKAIRAKVEGRKEDYAKYSQQMLTFTSDMLAEARDLLTFMGIPYIDAPSEGEAQASHMCSTDKRVFAVASQDYDSLLFGAPTLIRNVTISGRRKMPGKNVYREVVPEQVELAAVLESLSLTREQLVEVALLVGTDYNLGVKGIGPKKALDVVREGSFSSHDVDATLKDLFLSPKVTDDYEFSFSSPQSDSIESFLCDKRDFSHIRVERALERLEKGIESVIKQETLDQWF